MVLFRWLLLASVLNWRCQLTQIDLYNGRKKVVIVVVVSAFLVS